MEPIILDLDDFHQNNNDILALNRLKELIPNLKVNLFTVVGLSHPDFIAYHRKNYPWMDFIPHGWFHTTSREAENWTYEESVDYLYTVEQIDGYTKGFKAPGWQVSDGTLRALSEKGWWVADQEYNNHRRPKELRAYLLDSPNKIHGHIGHMGGHNANALEFILDRILTFKDREFAFIKDIV